MVKALLVVFLACPRIATESREKALICQTLKRKKNHGWKEKTVMALRHSDRHLDPYGHSHGPRRDELHGWRIARACTICPRIFISSTARSLWWSRSVSSLIKKTIRPPGPRGNALLTPGGLSTWPFPKDHGRLFLFLPKLNRRHSYVSFEKFYEVRIILES